MTGVRAVVAVVVLLLGLGGGIAIATAQRASYEDSARQNAREELDKAWQRVAEALRAQMKEQAGRAQTLAETDGVKSLVKASTKDSAPELSSTLTDLSRNEPWFQGAVAEAQASFFLEQSSIWSTTPTVSFDATQLVNSVLQEPIQTVTFDSAGVLLAVGVARVPAVTLQQATATFVLWKPVSLAALAASQPSWAFSISGAGKRQSGGSVNGVEALQASQTTFRDLPCCTTQEFAPGLTLAVFVDPQKHADELKAASQSALVRMGGIGGALGLLGAVLVVLLARRRTSADDARDELIRETQVQLKQSQEALQRLSTGAFATQAAAGNAQPAPLDLALASTQASVTASRYEVVAPLGEGGMARVYVAIVRGAEGFKRTFVLKRLKADHVGNQELVNQFIDEARLGASLVHSNIVPILDFGRDAEGYFLTQEYILGRNVDALIEASMTKRGKPLEPAVVAAIGQEALKALRYAHTRTDDSGRAAGLVHRDVSPANLMVSRRGEVKLLDFGIVKSADRVTQTQAGMVKGNLFYMSPEQARALPVDPRSDLFSLGMVMATALLGRTLYSGDSMFELMNRAAIGPTASDLELLAKGAGSLTQFVAKALSVDPALRCENAAQMADELNAVLPAAPSSQLEALMSELFGSDLDAERQRFSGAA